MKHSSIQVQVVIHGPHIDRAYTKGVKTSKEHASYAAEIGEVVALEMLEKLTGGRKPKQ
jgi:hypothetical protein